MKFGKGIKIVINFLRHQVTTVQYTTVRYNE